jgi:hypothetical protein
MTIRMRKIGANQVKQSIAQPKFQADRSTAVVLEKFSGARMSLRCPLNSSVREIKDRV